MMFLYDIPQWVMGVLIVGTCVATIVTAYLFTRNRMGHAVFTDTQVGAALSFLGVMATVTALLLAFTAVSVWESFSTAETAVVNEANEAAELARDLAVYGPEAVPAREAVREYVLLAVDVEWPLMASASSSIATWNQLDEIFRETAKLDPKTPQQLVLLGEVWMRVNGLTKARRDRIHASQASVPTTLWVVVILGAALTFAPTPVLPVSRFSLALVACLAASLGLVFFFIVAMNHPFAGYEGVRSDPLRSTLANMQRWDDVTLMRRTPD